MTRAMLLCAGLGTRLGALSDQLPKPMLPVCDIPIVRYGIALLAGHGIRDIVINLHHRGDVIERELGDGSHLNVNIHYVHEAELLGTGGGLKNACSLLDPEGTDAPFLSLNGKLIFDLDLHALLAAFERAGDVMGMMVVRRVPDALDWGAVYVETELEVPRVCDIFGRGKYMFSGVHVTRPSVVQRLPDGEACMVRQGYLPWIREGRTVAAFVDDGGAFFAEHSTPARYLQSNLALVQGARLRCAPGALHGVHPSASIHSSAVIEPPVRIGAGAIIGEHAVVGPDAIIGAGAEIEPGARVTRAVVWRGARAQGHLEQCIVTPTVTIPADQ